MRFLILGHPRCGTGYMAKLFQSMGLDVGHEVMGVDGISCWSWATDHPAPPWAPGPRSMYQKQKYLIHVVRDPVKAIPSIWSTDRDAESLAYRRKYSVRSLGISEMQGAAMSYLTWNRIIQAQRPHLFVRVEDAARDLPAFLRANHVKFQEPTELPPTNYNHSGRSVSMNEFELHEALGDMINSFVTQVRAEYGYASRDHRRKGSDTKDGAAA